MKFSFASVLVVLHPPVHCHTHALVCPDGSFIKGYNIRAHLTEKDRNDPWALSYLCCASVSVARMKTALQLKARFTMSSGLVVSMICSFNSLGNSEKRGNVAMSNVTFLNKKELGI